MSISDELFNQSVYEIDLCIEKLIKEGLTVANINSVILGRLIVLNRHFKVEDRFKDVLYAIVNGEVDDAQESQRIVQ